MKKCFLHIKRPGYSFLIIKQFDSVIDAQRHAINKDYEKFTIKDRNGATLYHADISEKELRVASEAFTSIQDPQLKKVKSLLNQAERYNKMISNPYFDFTAAEGES